MEAIVSKWKSLLKENKYLLMVVVLGIGLMLIPGNTEAQAPVVSSEVPASPDYAQQLEQILGQIQGVGKVKVMLTVSQGEQTIYEYDEDVSQDDSGTDSRRDTILVTDSQRNQTGLVKQVLGPVFQGAVVVCQGADSATVRLWVVEAVSNATGLSAGNISVIKMK